MTFQSIVAKVRKQQSTRLLTFKCHECHLATFNKFGYQAIDEINSFMMFYQNAMQMYRFHLGTINA